MSALQLLSHCNMALCIVAKFLGVGALREASPDPQEKRRKAELHGRGTDGGPGLAEPCTQQCDR